jgi:LytS/YehU family sensor histidine kinase
MTYFVCSACSSSLRGYILVSVFNSTIWIALWIGNAHVSILGDRFFSWTEQPAKRLFFGLVSTFGYTLAVVYVLTMLFRWLTNIDVDFQRDVAYVTIGFTFAISAFMHGHGFLMNWRQAALDVETFKKESAIAKYESLKNQINPHFLFNSLNALTNLVYEDQDKAAKFIKQLSDVYRYVLDTREKEVITLKEELGFVRSYLFLQQIRFGNNLKVAVDLDGVDGQIAPLALQLLVENAIKHNVISTDDPLSIKIDFQDGFICVENNLQKKTMISETGAGLGLENIKSRYKFLTDEEVFISEADEKFLVKLPLIKMDEV